jgi:predicted secreted protein
VSISRVAYGLSKEAREKVEGELTAQAIARFRARAGEMSQQFGFGSFSVREVNVTGAEAAVPGPVPMLRTAAVASQEASLPVEAGKATVTVSVSGSVQMQPR